MAQAPKEISEMDQVVLPKGRWRMGKKREGRRGEGRKSEGRSVKSEIGIRQWVFGSGCSAPPLKNGNGFGDERELRGVGTPQTDKESPYRWPDALLG
jgi:hypothetical protein